MSTKIVDYELGKSVTRYVVERRKFADGLESIKIVDEEYPSYTAAFASSEGAFEANRLGAVQILLAEMVEALGISSIGKVRR